MAVPNRGFGSYIGLGEESTWGTAVSRTNWLRVVSGFPKRELNIVNRPHLGTNGAASNNRRQHFTESDFVGGRFEHLVAYDDSSVLLAEYALGKNVTAGSGPYTHTNTLNVPRTGVTALTLEAGYGEGDAEVFEGCLISAFEYKLSAGGVLTASYDFIGQTSGGLASQGTPTYSSNGEEVLHHHSGQFGFNSINWDLTDIAIRADKKLARRLLLGSVNTQEPTTGDFTEVTVDLTVEYGQAAGFNAAWLAGTQGDATITFTGTGNNAITITMQNAYVKNIGRPISGAGIITQTVSMACESDGTDPGLAIVFTNDNAANTTN